MGTRWSEGELALLRDVSLSLAEVAARTGRSYSSVKHKASRAGLVNIRDYWLRGADHGNANWPAAELALLQDTSLRLVDVAELTGKSFSACASKAHQAGIWRGRRAGAEHPRWVDGNYSESYRGPDWPQVRQVVLERDGYICQGCGFVNLSGFDLAVHHCIPWRLRQSNDLAWLTTLCRPCHSGRSEHSWTEIPEAVLLQLRSA